MEEDQQVGVQGREGAWWWWTEKPLWLLMLLLLWMLLFTGDGEPRLPNDGDVR